MEGPMVWAEVSGRWTATLQKKSDGENRCCCSHHCMKEHYEQGNSIPRVAQEQWLGTARAMRCLRASPWNGEMKFTSLRAAHGAGCCTAEVWEGAALSTRWQCTYTACPPWLGAPPAWSRDRPAALGAGSARTASGPGLWCPDCSGQRLCKFPAKPGVTGCLNGSTKGHRRFWKENVSRKWNEGDETASSGSGTLFLPWKIKEQIKQRWAVIRPNVVRLTPWGGTAPNSGLLGKQPFWGSCCHFIKLS